MNCVLWPPLAESEREHVARWKCILSWFVGPLAETIYIPFSGGAGCHPPPFASLASLTDVDKVRVLSPEAVAERVVEENFLFLVRVKDASGIPDNSRLLTGSVALQGVPGGGSRSEIQNKNLVYFVGSPDTDANDAFLLVSLAYWLDGGEDPGFLAESKSKLLSLRKEAAGYEAVGLFGTGPSLAESQDIATHGRFNIICNTIVKNVDFFRRLDPKIIVATDAHFHFSYHRYSARFLADLKCRLDSSESYFFTFDKFAKFLKYRLPEIGHRCIGMPAGRARYGYDFDEDFRVFPGDSVLNMYMLPLASFLAERIEMPGFTVRAPSDEILLRVEAARAKGKQVVSLTTSFYSALQ